MNGLIVTRPAKKIESLYKAKETQASEPIVTDLQKSKSGSTQYEVVKKYYDMGGSSTGDQIYKCGIHDYETRSMKEFNEHVALSPHSNTRNSSKAPSVSGTNKIKAIHDFINSKH